MGWEYQLRRGGSNQILVAAERASGQAATLTVNLPSLLVDGETSEVIEIGGAGSSSASNQLAAALVDAGLELCRIEIDKANDALPSDPVVSDDCAVDISTTSTSFVRLPGPLTQDLFANPDGAICNAECLLGDDCFPGATGGTGGTGGGGGDNDAPFKVNCECNIESINNCNAGSPAPIDNQVTAQFCVPDTELPADFCRTHAATYMASSIRAISDFNSISGGNCGVYGPNTGYDVQVRCSAKQYSNRDIETDAVFAYATRDATCEAGCGSVACTNTIGSETCNLTHPSGGTCSAAEPCVATCDCDILTAGCHPDCDDPGEVCDPASVCLAETDGTSRLKSANTLLQGDWFGSDDFTCAQIPFTPGDTLAPTLPEPSTVGSSPVENGTGRFPAGLQFTCPVAATDAVDIGAFDTDLEELCRAIPLCEMSDDLDLSIEAKDGSTVLASATLDKAGDTITTTASSTTLAVGDHTLDLCVEDVATGVEACGAQDFRASAPLGSGVDTFGYFAGEMAADWVPLASATGATLLSLTDDGVQRVSLPSGFTFPLYGSTVSGDIWVGANGGISTSSGPIAPSNTGLPAQAAANAPDIAVYWDDLDPSSGGVVYTWFDGQRFIVSWEDVPHGRDSSSSTSDGVNVQAHIYGDGRMEFHYLDTDVGDVAYDYGDSATVGIGDTVKAVEVLHDQRTILLDGLKAVGIGKDTDGCFGDNVRIPPELACTTADLFVTVCTPTGDSVTMPLPDVSLCAPDAVAVEGEVIASGEKESEMTTLSPPGNVEDGRADLDQGVHQIRWWPVDAEDKQAGPAFTQLVFVETWVHASCGGSRSRMAFTEGDDTYAAAPTAEPLALLGLDGDDVLVAAADDDFIGDGRGAGVCEANDGDDLMVGEGGNDTLDAGSGNDKAWGGLGADLLLGESGDDLLDGGPGGDILQGGTGDDAIWGGTGDDLLEGGEGDDTLHPGSGVDVVDGGAGDDTIVIVDACELTAGQSLQGGTGADTLVLPVGTTLSDVLAAGVTVSADIESVQSNGTLPSYQARCGGNN